jgi:hypothetical protein
VAEIGAGGGLFADDEEGNEMRDEEVAGQEQCDEVGWAEELGPVAKESTAVKMVLGDLAVVDKVREVAEAADNQEDGAPAAAECEEETWLEDGKVLAMSCRGGNRTEALGAAPKESTKNVRLERQKDGCRDGSVDDSGPDRMTVAVAMVVQRCEAVIVSLVSNEAVPNDEGAPSEGE